MLSCRYPICHSYIIKIESIVFAFAFIKLEFIGAKCQRYEEDIERLFTVWFSIVFSFIFYSIEIENGKIYWKSEIDLTNLLNTVFDYLLFITVCNISVSYLI